MINADQIFSHSIKSVNFEHSLIGFGSTIIYMLGTFDYCMKYEIDFKYNPYGMTRIYNDTDKSVWTEVFEPNSLTLNYDHDRRYDVVNSLPYSMPFFNYLYCCDDKTFFISKKWAKIFNNIITHHLKLNDNLINYIENQSMSLGDDSYFGIHLRGTDMEAHGKLEPIENKINQVKNEFEKSNCNKIFLMTDEQNLLHLAQKIFKDKLYYYDFITRSDTNKPIHHNRTTANGFKIFTDLILEMYTMRKCKNLFLSRSGVSAFIASLNPDATVALFNDDMSAHHLNVEKNKLVHNFPIQITDRRGENA